MHYLVKGEFHKEGPLYVAEIPALRVSAQGKNAFNSLMSLKQMVETLVGDETFKCSISADDKSCFFLGANDQKKFQRLIRKRVRQLPDFKVVIDLC